jgi:hypothetical protein
MRARCLLCWQRNVLLFGCKSVTDNRQEAVIFPVRRKLQSCRIAPPALFVDVCSWSESCGQVSRWADWRLTWRVAGRVVNRLPSWLGKFVPLPSVLLL